jgi:tetrahydromethanopterin S-methyltransferase subunit C
MPRVPVFGWVSMGLGVVGVIVASVLLVDPLSPSAFIGVLSLIVFHVVVGWKVYRLSRTPEGFSR